MSKKESNDKGVSVGVIDEKTAMAGINLLKAVTKDIKRKNNRKFYIVLVFVVVLAAVIGFFVGPALKNMLEAMNPPPPVAVINELTDEEKADILKDKSIEIQKLVLGESRQRKELLVLERDVDVESQWESAWGGIEVFKKTKRIVSYGTGYYNIDLEGIAEDKINVDHDLKTVTVTVPHAFLKSVSIDEGKTQYEDTQNGLLSFGELKLTMEQQGILKASVEESMKEKLSDPAILAEADRTGKVMVSEIYQPLISAVANDYFVEIQIA